MNGSGWNNYMHDLHQYIEEQAKIIKKLEARMETLEKAVPEKSNHTTIEKIEYKFDQLKIEHLDGTLHIGMSPSDLANMDDFNGQQPQQQPNYQMPFKQKLTSELNGYLKETGPSLIRNLSAQHHYSIDEAYQSILLQDIAKQLPERVAYYEQEAVKSNQSGSMEQLRLYITDRIKNEINQSLMQYMQTNGQKGDGENNEYGSTQLGP